MKICLNSRNLSEHQKSGIEKYFHDNFTFCEKGPQLIWKEDESEFVLLGFPKGPPDQVQVARIARDAHDAPLVMFRVHENELLRIAGRKIRNWVGGQAALRGAS